MSKDSRTILAILGGSLVLLILVFVAVFSIMGLSTGNTVAVIPLQGEIGYSPSSLLSGDVVTPETIDQEIKQAEDDPSVSAIVLEINSPGGSPVASEEIMTTVKECKKPVVAWITDTGASGAYLVASSADKIVANPASTVGSIGVILTLTDLSQLYQMIGVDQYSIKAGEYKDMGADYRNLTPEETEMLQEMVDQDYDYFITLVAQNRQLDESYVRSIAEGKIYTGTQAKDIKLVDETGGKQKALDLAAQLGGIKGSYHVITITPTETLEDVMNNFSSSTAYYLGKGIGSFMQKGAIQYDLS
jgi:protease IV